MVEEVIAFVLAGLLGVWAHTAATLYAIYMVRMTVATV